jgi:hypothetical protein
MAALTQINGQRLWNGLRLAGWSFAAAILLLPLVAMQFTSEVDWSLSDFIVMGALVGGSGLVIELATRRSDSLAYRFGVVVAVTASFLLVWVNLAVGFLGDEGNPANLMFLGVIGVAVIGSVAARGRPSGTSRAMLVAAVAQLLVGVLGLAAGWASPGGAGVYEVALGTGLFTPLWLLSAWLFRKAT